MSTRITITNTAEVTVGSFCLRSSDMCVANDAKHL